MALEDVVEKKSDDNAQDHDLSSHHSSGIMLEVSSPSSSSSSSSSRRSSSENIDVKAPLENSSSSRPESSNSSPSSPSHSQPKPVNSPRAQSPIPPMKSPPAQAMGYPPGYDPNRIPASVFSTKPSNPGEWSVNSNESLFSIQMGNNSFSQDYAILYGKSGELPRLDDWSTAQPPVNLRSNNVPEPSSLPPVREENSGELSRTPRKDDKKKSSFDAEVSKMNRSDDHHDHVMIKPGPVEVVSPPPHAPEVKKAPVIEVSGNRSSSAKHSATMPSPPRFSDESGNSGSSFAFPVLTNEKTSSLKSVPENPHRSPAQAADKEGGGDTGGRFMDTRWFASCFSCWPRTWCG